MSVGSFIHPSIGMALSNRCQSASQVYLVVEASSAGTFVKDITRWGIVNNHDLGQVWFYSGKVFDVRAVSIRAMLTIIPALEIFPVLL